MHTHTHTHTHTHSQLIPSHSAEQGELAGQSSGCPQTQRGAVSSEHDGGLGLGEGERAEEGGEGGRKAPGGGAGESGRGVGEDHSKCRTQENLGNRGRVILSQLCTIVHTCTTISLAYLPALRQLARGAFCLQGSDDGVHHLGKDGKSRCGKSVDIREAGPRTGLEEHMHTVNKTTPVVKGRVCNIIMYLSKPFKCPANGSLIHERRAMEGGHKLAT